MRTPLSAGLSARGLGAFVAAIAMTAVALISWSAHSATGHNVVVETSPVAGSTISDSPVDLRVVTNDQLLDLTGTGSGFALVVRDTNGLYYGDGCVTVGDNDMSATAALGDVGEYTITFQFVSADGHSLSDSFSFTFDPSPTHVPVPGFDDAPQCGVEPIMPITEGDETTATDLESAPDGVVADAMDEDLMLAQDNQRWPITVAIAGALVALSIALLVWMVRRRKGS
jgi:methionine-rich copper-binding protein CopC